MLLSGGISALQATSRTIPDNPCTPLAHTLPLSLPIPLAGTPCTPLAGEPCGSFLPIWFLWHTGDYMPCPINRTLVRRLAAQSAQYARWLAQNHHLVTVQPAQYAHCSAQNHHLVTVQPAQYAHCSAKRPPGDQTTCTIRTTQSGEQGRPIPTQNRNLRQNRSNGGEQTGQARKTGNSRRDCSNGLCSVGRMGRDASSTHAVRESGQDGNPRRDWSEGDDDADKCDRRCGWRAIPAAGRASIPGRILPETSLHRSRATCTLVPRREDGAGSGNGRGTL
jgi:hypothetical protein